ncbi:MAG TPA: FixH family protein [Patescibacteria group bacterium]|nr:FixH family protein [Patescibacteria group bacterium]
MNTAVAQRRSGWWYPYIFVGVFGVVLAVNLVFMYSAVHTFTGLETQEAYDKGLVYNQVIAQAKAQEKLAWTVDATLLPASSPDAASHESNVVVSFLDKDGQPVSGLSVKAQFVRPTMEGYDTAAELMEQGGGRYVATVKLPLAGQWELKVAAHKGEIDYKLGQRVLVP